MFQPYTAPAPPFVYYSIAHTLAKGEDQWSGSGSLDTPGLRSQARLLEAAFDNELEPVQQMVSAWVEECFSPLIGAKLDCTDANEHTPLSEAACGGALEVCSPCFGLRLGFGFGFGSGLGWG